MDIVINQTDFEASDEMVKNVTVQGKVVASDKNPGKNPCLSKMGGSPLAASDLSYALVSNLDVTDAVKNQAGNFTVTAAISQKVDECAVDQKYLLYGMVTIVCSPKSGSVAKLGALQGNSLDVESSSLRPTLLLTRK